MKLEQSINPQLLSLLTEIAGMLNARGIIAYLVGGTIRDLLMGRPTADIDIAVAADALSVASEMATALGGHYVPLDETHRIARVVLAHDRTVTPYSRWEIDFSSLDNAIESDLTRRDFTIDAIAVELSQFIRQPQLLRPDQLTAGHKPAILIDPTGGSRDLINRTIRATGDATFREDPARLLRAVRLAGELGFSMTGDTEALIRRDCHLVAAIAGERVRDELLRLLAIPQSGYLCPYLDQLGLLTAVIPELNPLKGASQPREHHWDVCHHSLHTVAAVDYVLRCGPWPYTDDAVGHAVPWSERLGQHFDREVSRGSTRRSLLKLAALLHDIAKPQTKTVTADGRTRFLGHSQQGAAIADDILHRLRFSTKETRLVETLITAHLRPTQMSHQGLPSRRAVYRYFRDTGDAAIDILFLSLADHLATRGPNLDLSQWREHTTTVAHVVEAGLEEETAVSPPRLIDGHDIINIFNLSPGPRIGELLELVQEARSAGEITNREQALSYIKQKLVSSS